MSKNNKNKNVKVVQSNYDVELKINNFSEKFNVSHKMTKKDKLEITIKDKIKTFKLSLKETKSKIKVKQIKIVEKIENKSKETLVSLDKIEYVDDFEIKVRDFYVPVTVLINPVLELYYDIEKINTEMKPNKSRMKMKKNRYNIDCSIKKEDYIVESSALSVEELEELYKEDEDNQLGVYLEYLKRRHEQEDEAEEIVTNEIKDMIFESKKEIDELNAKHKKEKEELSKKINEKIKHKKEKVVNSDKKLKEEEIPLLDLICSVFEDCGKKELFMKAYDKGNYEIVKVIKSLIKERPELEYIILKMIDIKLEQKHEVKLANFIKGEILKKEEQPKFNKKYAKEYVGRVKRNSEKTVKKEEEQPKLNKKYAKEVIRTTKTKPSSTNNKPNQKPSPTNNKPNQKPLSDKNKKKNNKEKISVKELPKYVKETMNTIFVK